MSDDQNKKVSLNELVLQSLYYRYKAFIVPVSTILVCVFLFFFVIIPQFQNFLATKDEITTNVNNLNILKSNLQLVTSLNDDNLNTTLSTATNALPSEKDFNGILSALNNSAAIAGTSLGNYSFSIGDLTGIDQSGKATQLPLQLNVVVIGDINTAGRFVSALKNQLPISDAISIVSNNDNTNTVTVAFYYATLPKISFTDTVPLPLLSSSDIKLLTTLSSSQVVVPVVASPSALPSTTPTPKLIPTLAVTPIATGSVSTVSGR